MRIKDIGELGLIKRLSKGIRVDGSVVHGIGDDTAVLEYTKDKYQLFTCDMLLEDVHFTLKTATPFQIGWKALCRNISDIAAMGGIPRFALVSMAIDPDADVKLADGIYKGMKAAAEKFGVNIVGGDMARSKKLVIDVSLIGEVEKSKLVTRDGARVGDMIYVTGPVGGSKKGKHLTFTPRVKESRAIVAKVKPTAMIDISDGLLLDLGRILDRSGVGAVIYEESVPVSNAAESFDKAVTDGEDFELLFTLPLGKNGDRHYFPVENEGKIVSVPIFPTLPLGKIASVPIFQIGRITKKNEGFRLIRPDGSIKIIGALGYVHF